MLSRKIFANHDIEEKNMRISRLAVVIMVSSLPFFTSAQDNVHNEIQHNRQFLRDGNPAELIEAKGEILWKTRRGPKNVSLEHCDLGFGPGVVKGVYVRLPRFFSDTGKVQDVESRLVTCMVALQGYTPEQAKKDPFSADFSGTPSVMEALVAWIASESRGMKITPSLSHPKEQQAYEIGEKIFYYRAGPHDFACVICHNEDNKRIRLQRLPNFNNPTEAAGAFGPAYRITQGVVRSMQWRMWDCFRQARFPALEYTSDASIALIMFLAKRAEGGTFDAPAVKF
jgi:sulfur-oxidizing protein SoxA